MKEILYAFDLDDTLIKSESKVDLVRNGKHYELTPAQFANYVEKEGDKLNFAQFKDIKGGLDQIILEPMIGQFVDLLKKSVINPNIHVGIVTARGQDVFPEVLEFFNLYLRYVRGLSFSETQKLLRKIEYSGLNSSNPFAKKEHIEGYITGKKVDKPGMSEVYFYDDSQRNVDAVKELGRETGVPVHTFLVKNGATTVIVAALVGISLLYAICKS